MPRSGRAGASLCLAAGGGRIPVMVRVEKSRSEGKHEEEDFLAEAAQAEQPQMAAEEGAGWKSS